ncbi:alpha/beta fold hydrolase [Herbiconiux ginsengi]|uniref:Pimeloyl-ACP methyl ester carboxylesterase n=1 Tax=Herbiconiux ginsengi TaxID=381665 RepID=A0A1H3SXK2_9MICO|nr:alpha/beta hydrolase [Herbiconiux ginsengi]SDZ42291.1 Pimeloyl-ACP methyl ester carboxylesterase [Herbiconiux ginsengi]
MHIILVHGAGGSSASWSLVTPLLDERGLSYSVADNPSQSLTDDVASVNALIDAAGEPVLLVGHSYGGAVITNAGRNENVHGLVYVAAFAPAEGESVQKIVNSYPEALVSSFMTRGDDGEWIPDGRPEARQALAWDVPDEIWEARDDDNRVSANAIFTGETGAPAWQTLPAWYLLATNDKHIRIEAQRDMAERAGAVVSEVDTSHAVPHAAPARVVEIIEQALGSIDPIA